MLLRIIVVTVCFVTAATSRAADLKTLHDAVFSGDEKAVARLIRSGADVNALDEGQGGTPLCIATSRRSPKVMALLIKAKADVNIRCSFRGTALHLAAHEGDAEMVRTLLAAGADVKARDRQGMIPLGRAADAKDSAVAEALIRAGSDVHHLDQAGNTAMHVAAGIGQVKVLQLLLDAGAKVDVMGGMGTPLWSAVVGERTAAVRLLLDAGANPAQEWMFKTPVEYARETGNQTIVAMLEEALKKKN